MVILVSKVPVIMKTSLFVNLYPLVVPVGCCSPFMKTIPLVSVQVPCIQSGGFRKEAEEDTESLTLFGSVEPAGEVVVGGSDSTVEFSKF